MVNYGLVGAGYFGADLARVMNQQEDAKVTVVYDPDNGEKIAQELGCDAAGSLDELVEREDISCVIVGMRGEPCGVYGRAYYELLQWRASCQGTD